MVDNRRYQRRRVLKEGVIQARGLGLDCTVRNLSATGALLIAELDGKSELDQLTLVVVSEKLVRKCKVVWQAGNKMGVAFV